MYPLCVTGVAEGQPHATDNLQAQEEKRSATNRVAVVVSGEAAN